jgi:hypothetical protein
MSQRSGKPWSGSNPIPNIQKFVENLDKDKKERDRKIDEENKAVGAGTGAGKGSGSGSGVKPHENKQAQTQSAGGGSGSKTVTDPVTKNQVVIEDVGKDFMKAVKDPQVCNALFFSHQSNPPHSQRRYNSRVIEGNSYADALLTLLNL